MANTRADLEQHFEMLLAANRAALSRLASSYTNTAADREDMLQDIAMALWKAIPTFRGECSERTFVYRIAHNRAIHSLTRRRPESSGTDNPVESVDPAPTAETAIVRHQETLQLADAVRRLPLLYRQVVVLMLEGLEYAEIAEVLGISESNVGVRLNRARAAATDDGRTQMNVDNELELWRSEWSSQTTAEMPDLAQKVKRQSRFMRWMIAVEVLITIVIGGGTIELARRSGEADFIALAIATWFFVTVAWTFAIWNRRGAWSPASLNTAEYLAISIKRCRSAIRAAAFGMLLFSVEMLFCLGWIYNHLGTAAFLMSTEMIVVGVGSIAFSVAIKMYRSRKQSELKRLRQLEAEMLSEGPNH